MKSHNVVFRMPTPEGEDADAPGEIVAEGLRAYLAGRGITVTDLDFGFSWTFVASVPKVGAGAGVTERVQVVVAGCDEMSDWVHETGEMGRWILQVSDPSPPGLFARLLGAKARHLDAELRSLSDVVHEWLSSRGATGVLWRVDGEPGEDGGRFATDRP